RASLAFFGAVFFRPALLPAAYRPWRWGLVGGASGIRTHRRLWSRSVNWLCGLKQASPCPNRTDPARYDRECPKPRWLESQRVIKRPGGCEGKLGGESMLLLSASPDLTSNRGRHRFASFLAEQRTWKCLCPVGR